MRIKSIKHLKYENPIPVYDFTVEKTHDFLLGAGVYVHNSKDLADAVCGSIKNALDSRSVRARIKSIVPNTNDANSSKLDQDILNPYVLPAELGGKVRRNPKRR